MCLVVFFNVGGSFWIMGRLVSVKANMNRLDLF